MKKFLRPLTLLSLVLVLGGCNRKKTTVETANPEVTRQPSRDEAVSAVEPPAGSPPGAAPAASPSPAANPARPAEPVAPGPNADPPAVPTEDPQLIGLSPADKAKFEAWFKKYNLTSDSATMEQDADGDGYSNREEFLAMTNPRDPKSLPGVLEGAALKGTEEVPVPLILREVKDGKARVEHTESKLEEQLTEGAAPKGTRYKVTGMKHAVKADKHGVYSDVSNVTLLDTDTRETVVLIRDLPARSSKTNAVITGPNGEEKRVHLDETVELPGLPGRQFKVMELRSDQVVVEELGTKRTLSIPKR